MWPKNMGSMSQPFLELKKSANPFQKNLKRVRKTQSKKETAILALQMLIRHFIIGLLVRLLDCLGSVGKCYVSGHMVKGQKFSGGKRSKERISVLVGASAGGEKLPLLTIGKFQQPRCFRRSSPPIQYFANKKAWMTASIFVDYIKHLEVKFKRERRRIALILDNCSAHPHEIPKSSSRNS